MKNLAKTAAGIYIYRRRVPTDLIDRIGRRELKQFLDTRDLAVALERFPAAQRWAEGLITAARKQTQPGDDFDRLAGRWLHAQLTSAAIESARLPPPAPVPPSDDFDTDDATQPEPRSPAMYDPGPEPWRHAQAEEAARQLGLKLRPGSRAAQQWQQAIDRALGDLSRADDARSWNEPIPAHIERRAADAMQPTISDGHRGWVAKRKSKMTMRTDHEAAYVLGLWTERNGDSLIAEITKRQVAQFRDDLIAEGRAASTVKKLMQYFKGFIDAAIADGLIDIVNPAAGLSFAGIKSKSRSPKRRAFSLEELARLFMHPAFTAPDFRKPMPAAKFWLPLLGLYAGARQSELIWLDRSDVKEIDSIHCIEIREDETVGRTLKTEAAARTVPLHSALINLGFLDYAARCKHRLFDVPPDAHDNAGGAFSRHINRVIDHATKDRAVSFHSLRHNFLQAAVAANVPREIRRRIAGHADDHVAELNYSESAGIPLARIKDAIDSIAYQSVDLAAITAAAASAIKKMKR